jgi:hypothetical protein
MFASNTVRPISAKNFEKTPKKSEIGRTVLEANILHGAHDLGSANFRKISPFFKVYCAVCVSRGDVPG